MIGQWILKAQLSSGINKEFCNKKELRCLRTVRTVQDLHDPDNHDGVITDLEPDILECEVKWALESITMNKASGGDGIPGELFQILKDMSICVAFWKDDSEVKLSGLESQPPCSLVWWPAGRFSNGANVLSPISCSGHCSGNGTCSVKLLPWWNKTPGVKCSAQYAA